MIHSMTGYAARTRDIGSGVINFEMKSVNSRYSDFQFRICDDLRAIEPALRELFSAKINRGKLECKLGFVTAPASHRPLALNSELLRQLREFESQVRNELPSAASLTVNEVLRWPGMFGDDSPEMDSVLPACLTLAKEALDDFMESRAREGQKLSAIIMERVTLMRDRVAGIAPWIQTAQASFQEKLRQRLTDALGIPDDSRVLQEVVLFAARIDVAEELGRLTTHLDEVERVLKTGGVCGKRLDFLMQELNREANTLGSKSMLAEVSQVSMDLKLLIEQMREQIQNLE